MANFSGGRENYGSFPPLLLGGNYGQFFWRVVRVRFPPFPSYWGGQYGLEPKEVSGEECMYNDGHELINVHATMGPCDLLKFHLAALVRAGWCSLRVDPSFDFHGFTLGGYTRFGVVNGFSSWLANSESREMGLPSRINAPRTFTNLVNCRCDTRGGGGTPPTGLGGDTACCRCQLPLPMQRVRARHTAE